MCVGIPMKLVEIKGDLGVVEEAGVSREVGLSLLDSPQVGQYVIVHAGYAIELIDPDEAQETIELLRRAGLLDEKGLPRAPTPPGAEGQ